jgi:hypothetical protein
MKLYVQLRPDEEGMLLLRSAQQALYQERRCDLVKIAAIHMTVLHIGAVGCLIDSMKCATSMDCAEISRRIHPLIEELEKGIAIAGDASYTLMSSGYDHFGTHGFTYVVTFKPTLKLQDLYERSLAALKTFFASCDIVDVDDFMANDANLKYALTLRPHVTIAKGCKGDGASGTLQQMTFTCMPVLYER